MATLDCELFICERYRPMAGWSMEYLLPTDRHAYRMRNCKKSWRSLAEVEAAMLPPGWTWEESRDEAGNAIGWVPDTTGQQVDDAGWSYAGNFLSNFDGSAKASLQKFCRWKRMVRTKTFASSAESFAVKAAGTNALADFLARSCPNVDLTEADRVGQLLVEAVATASLGHEWNHHALVSLKEKMLEKLLSPKHVGDKEKVEGMIAGFVRDQKGVASRLSGVFKGGGGGSAADIASMDGLAARLLEVGVRFPTFEREAYATLAIRKYRPDLACRITEEHECPLKPVLCPHGGCKARVCANALEAHDKVCARKLMTCEKCNEEVPRGELRVHATAACPLREAKCTFSEIGCHASLSHANIGTHLEECTQAHLMMMMRLLVDQQEVVQNMQKRIVDLEAQNGELAAKVEEDAAARAAQREADLKLQSTQRETDFRSHTAVATQVTAWEGKLLALEKKATQDLKDMKKAHEDEAGKSHKKTDEVDKEARKRHESFEKSHKTEVGELRAEITGLKEANSKLAALHHEVGTVKASLAEVQAARSQEKSE